MKLIYMLGVLPLAGLAACSGMMAENATKKAQAECAAKSKQFVTTNVEKHDNPIYSSAEVVGHCVGPGDPGYVAPQPKS
jgi:hypothetical protein